MKEKYGRDIYQLIIQFIKTFDTTFLSKTHK